LVYRTESDKLTNKNCKQQIRLEIRQTDRERSKVAKSSLPDKKTFRYVAVFNFSTRSTNTTVTAADIKPNNCSRPMSIKETEKKCLCYHLVASLVCNTKCKIG